jgi:hypothetical protein
MPEPKVCVSCWLPIRGRFCGRCFNADGSAKAVDIWEDGDTLINVIPIVDDDDQTENHPESA